MKLHPLGKTIAVLGLAVMTQTAVFAAEPPATGTVWRPDNPTVDIYDKGSVSDDYYAVEMLDASGTNYVVADYLTPGEPVRLLMVNGGVVPGARVIVENNRALVPVRAIAEALGAEVGWDAASRTVAISGAGTRVTLTVDSEEASVNGQGARLDAPARIIERKTFVPLRFVAEAFQAEVGYNGSFAQGSGVNIATVESPAGQPKYTREDGLAAVKILSEKMHQQTADYLKETGRAFSAPHYPDYDPDAVRYVTTVGRYDVYWLAGFENYGIFYNNRTGEVYSLKAGLPFFGLSKGFINISWMYQ